MNRVLFGFKGCGKTYFGRLLAKKLQCSFIDTDERILDCYQQTSGKILSIKELHQKIGEEAFRLLEKEVVQELQGIENSVIALGGGTVLFPENLKILQAMGTMIYLKISLETLQKRGVTFSLGPIEDLYGKRLSLYESIPAICVLVDSLQEQEIVEQMSRTYGI